MANDNIQQRSNYDETTVSVSQAECFRAGLDTPNSIQLLEIDPSTLPQEQRDLIADRLNGINVCRLGVYSGGEEPEIVPLKDSDGDLILLEAKQPGFEHLVEAAKRNAAEVQKQLTKAHTGTDRPY